MLDSSCDFIKKRIDDLLQSKTNEMLDKFTNDTNVLEDIKEKFSDYYHILTKCEFGDYSDLYDNKHICQLSDIYEYNEDDEIKNLKEEQNFKNDEVTSARES